uniref:Uncharacterized protein n=1 Tax=Arion vulgaris TaxID=1028688 RepID=A0A0B7B1K7_9EUPU
MIKIVCQADHSDGSKQYFFCIHCNENLEKTMMEGGIPGKAQKRKKGKINTKYDGVVDSEFNNTMH